MGKVRIISGLFKSRVIKFPDKILGLRPTHDRVREDLFNWLMFDIEQKTCLDLFAGSGILGFEAISRGAKSVTMLELNKSAYHNLVINKKLLINCDNLDILNTDSIKYLQQSNKNFDVIFLDPPYDSELLIDTLNIIVDNMGLYQNSLIYVETNKHIDLTRFNIIKHKKTSSLYYMLLKLK